MGRRGEPRNLDNFAAVSRGISRAGPRKLAKFPRKTASLTNLHPKYQRTLNTSYYKCDSPLLTTNSNQSWQFLCKCTNNYI